jgi:acetyltransferase-like isoleucine patch superfamily enzyme
MKVLKKIRKFREDPLIIFSMLIGLLYVTALFLSKKAILGKNIKIIGSILIDLRSGSLLDIADGVLLRSRNRGYHGVINSRIKLMCDENAKITIGANTRFYGSCIHSSSSITIGERCLVASNVQIFDRNGHNSNFINPQNRINTYGKIKEVIIGNDVWIGTGVVITPGSIIPDGSIIMANSVVSGVFKNKSLIGGVPAKILKEYL